MKLKPADIDRILEDNIPKPNGMRSAQDFTAENEAAREALLQGLIAQSGQSTARQGTQLPPPPKSLVTVIHGPNDFGVTPSHNHTAQPTTTTTGTTVEGSAELVAERSYAQEIPLPPALRGTDLDKIECRADLIAALTLNIPLNELGLPKILYRSDVIDWKLFQGNSPQGTGVDPTDRYKTMQEFLDAATLYISYAEGFPSLPTGEPLWARMPFETDEHYASFTDYCVMPGARQLARMQGPLDQITNWFHEDYWAIRVKCYDMLNTIHAAKVREQRILACEDSHYLKAEAMLNKLQDQFNDINWEVLKADPKAYVDVLEKVVKLQRMALGQSSQAAEKREIKSESMEVTMRKIASPNIVEDKTKDGGVDVRQLLKNPGALSSAQELIISMTRTLTSTTSTTTSNQEAE